MYKLNIEGKIIIGKGEYHLPQLNLAKCVDDELTHHYYIIMSEKRKPLTTMHSLKESGTFAYGAYKKIGYTLYHTLLDAIEKRSEYKMLDNYTFLIAYCLGQGVCLFEQGIFDMKDKTWEV